MRTFTALLTGAGIFLALCAQAQTPVYTRIQDNLLVAPGPTPDPANRPSTLGLTGNGVVQGSLLVGATNYPVAVGANPNDAFFVGNTWFYEQLILAGSNRRNWSIRHNGNGYLQFFPGWQTPWRTEFTHQGDVRFPQRVAIGAGTVATTGLQGIGSLTLAVEGAIGARNAVYVRAPGVAWPD